MADAGRHADHPLDPHLDLPARPEVVFIKEPLRGTKREARQWHCRGVRGENRPADTGDAVIPAMDAEAMQMIVLPAHEHLDHVMQVGDRQAVRQSHSPPNRGMNIPQQSLQL